MASTANYRCLACTGPVHFVGATGRLECDYCGSSFSVEEMDKAYGAKVSSAEVESVAEDEKINKAKESVEKAGSEWDPEFNMKMLNCSTCGAQLITDENTVATSCPYCGNPTIIPGQFTAGRKPDVVIPFKLDKKHAVEALTNHYKNKKLLPNVFKDKNHIEEIKGVYVPFWLFDVSCDADVAYTGTKQKRYVSGEYEITKTDHYNMRRAGSMDFKMIPVDASKKMDNALMDSIEPFNYAELKEFSTSYLPGYFAESYDDAESSCESRLTKRAETSTDQVMYSDLGYYDSVSTTKKSINVNKTKTLYALLPVWLLNTKWNDQNFIFAMNGQTGKLVGNLPCDKGKYWRRFLKFFIILGGLGAFFAYQILYNWR